MSIFRRVSQETKQHSEDNPMLTKFWGEFDHSDIPDGEKLMEFTNFLEQNIGSLLIWHMTETNMGFMEWQEGRIDE